MAKIGLNISVEGYTGKLLIRWLKASAPLAEVGRSAAFDFPYNAVYTINGLQPVVYIVQLWRSADGSALSELIKQWEIDASVYNELHTSTYQYQVDRGDSGSELDEAWADPENLDTELIDERLDGYTQDQLYVVEGGAGPLLNTDYNLRPGGGIILLNGHTFNNGTKWFITVSKMVATQVQSGPSVGADYTNVTRVNDDTDVFTSESDNLYNKIINVYGAGPVVNLPFPSFATIPDMTKISVLTHEFQGNYATLAFDSAVWFHGRQRLKIHLPTGENIKLVFYGGVCYVDGYNGNDKIRGSIFGDDDPTRPDFGSFLPALEATGVLPAEDYPGLYEWLEDAGIAVALTDWSTQKTRWAIDTIAQTMRVPHLANMHRRFRAASEIPGVYGPDGVGPHRHDQGLAASGPPGSRVVGGAGSLPSDSQMEDTGDGIGTETAVKHFKEIPLIVL